ncbi:type VI secretion system accessory protein TagJ [Ruegeria jejuensis]|uniref:type VI secretion system accessory protein TagJ n=1 Tax=Ruegeria jejuensis TaxID=3233338 RepID=UPI00355BB7A4
MTQTTDVISRALSDDDLNGAVGAAVATVKSRPRDFEARMLLAELAVLAGDLGRAETQAKLAGQNAPDKALGLGVFRQHLRGIQARNAWWEDGALPVFPEGPSALSNLALKMNVALRSGDGDSARALLHQLDDERGAQNVIWDGLAFDTFRDLDDRLPHALEVVTAGGNYMWLEFDTLSEVRFEPVTRPLDLAYRRARVTLTNASAADLRIPAIYPAPEGAAQSLGRITDFSEGPGGLIFGHGQRGWLVGDDMQTCATATTLHFEEGDA